MRTSASASTSETADTPTFGAVRSRTVIVAAVLAMSGKKELKKVDPKLETTQRTLKEDVQWAKTQLKR